MRYRYLSLFNIVAVIFAALPSAPKADGSAYKVCNESKTNYAFSYLLRDGFGVFRDSWRWGGYFLIEAGDCGFFVPTHSVANIYLSITTYVKNDDKTILNVRTISLKKNQFHSTNGEAEVGLNSFCTGLEDARPLAGFEECEEKEKRFYTIYWTGQAKTHQQMNARPYILTIY